MYQSSSDADAGVLITIYPQGEHGDDDYERSVQELLRSDAAAAERGIPFVHFVVVSRNSAQPSARWRKRFSEVTKELRAQPYYFAFVSESALLRGAFTAVRWLRGELPNHHLDSFATFAPACAWVRKSTGAPYPQLESLWQPIAEHSA